jgi:5-methylcytosine-specific restriction endonuclease McrA
MGFLFFKGASGVTMAETKVCSKCGVQKDRSDFYKNKSRYDGLQSYCIECQKQQYNKNRPKELQRRKDYWEKNKDRITISHKEYYERNKESVNRLQKEWYERNKEKISKQRKEYREKNKAKIKDRARKYYKENKPQISKRAAIYWQKNKDMLKESHIEWRKKNIEKVKKHDKKRGQSPVLYDNYVQCLTTDEAPIADNNGFLLAKCTYCGRYYYPTRAEVTRRDQALKGQSTGENRLYCSDNCKKACPIFMQVSWPRDFKPATSREVQPELRQMRLACDEYSCQRCGKTIDDAQLHCHHIEGIKKNPIESADLDNTISLCKKCHKWAHTQEGCRYFELRCE